MTDLEKLLTDVYSQTNKDSLIKIFDEISRSLLRQVKIVTPKASFYIRELEIYYYDLDLHPDPYTHKNKRQLEFGDWYFHRYITIESFLLSNRNGVDITFGNKSKQIYGGILLRKLQHAESSELIVGINRVAKTLLSLAQHENANHLAHHIGKTVFDKTQALHLDVGGNNYSAPIYKTQRNGLTFKNNEVANFYYKAPYCYYNHEINSQIIEVYSGDN